MPPQTSRAISDAVQRFLAWFTPVGSPVADGGSGIWGTAVRKAAHFTEFFVLGGLLAVRFRGGRRRPWPALLAAVLTALADETIQHFTGRTSSVLDVWLDLCGAVAGTLAVWWFGRRRNPGAPEGERRVRREDGEQV